MVNVGAGNAVWMARERPIISVRHESSAGHRLAFQPDRPRPFFEEIRNAGNPLRCAARAGSSCSDWSIRVVQGNKAACSGARCGKDRAPQPVPSVPQGVGVACVDRRNRWGTGRSRRLREDDTISDIWVAPAFEGRGAGTALITALEAQIAERGRTQAQIQVAAANDRALRLYHNLGYRQLWRKVAFDPVLETDLEKIGLSKPLYCMSP